MTTATSDTRDKRQPLRKVATGIDGLDEILQGGVARGRSTLVQGGAGSGKSLMGLELLYRNALKGEPGILATFEERAGSIRQNAMTLGWDLAALEQDGRFFLLEARLDPTTVKAGDFNLSGLVKMIEAKARAMSARLIVLDALDALLQLLDNPQRERSALHLLHEQLLEQGMTTLLTVKQSAGTGASSNYEFLDYMTDCIIRLDQRTRDQISTRRLQVVKYRGSDYGKNEYPFAITGSGIKVISTSIGEFDHSPPGVRLTSGHSGLDELLGGGLLKGTCFLVAGPSGTGKTTLTSVFSAAAHQRGDRVLNIGFEESPDSLVAAMLSPGVDLRPAIEAGNLRFLAMYPESQGAEEHLIAAFSAANEFKPDHIVVDAVSACQRMGSEQSGFDYLVRLVTFAKKRGITCLLVNQTSAVKDVHELTGVGLSSLVDTMVLLRYAEIGGELNRTLLVLKSRGSRISNQWREYLITDHGIGLLDVYVGQGGVLTGAARQEQEEREALEQRFKELEMRRLEEDIASQHAALAAEAARVRAAVSAAEASLEGLKIEQRKVAMGRDLRRKMRGGDETRESTEGDRT